MAWFDRIRQRFFAGYTPWRSLVARERKHLVSLFGNNYNTASSLRLKISPASARRACLCVAPADFSPLQRP
jgi:hypothetical protein